MTNTIDPRVFIITDWAGDCMVSINKQEASELLARLDQAADAIAAQPSPALKIWFKQNSWIVPERARSELATLLHADCDPGMEKSVS